MSQNVKKCPHTVLRILKKFTDPDPEVNDFQNLISSSSSKDISPVKFSWRFLQ